MTWIDAKGREHKSLIAEKSLTVRDDMLGFDRQIIAGQPVPPDLESAYRSEAGLEQLDAADELAGKKTSSGDKGDKAAAAKTAGK